MKKNVSKLCQASYTGSSFEEAKSVLGNGGNNGNVEKWTLKSAGNLDVIPQMAFIFEIRTPELLGKMPPPSGSKDHVPQNVDFQGMQTSPRF